MELLRMSYQPPVITMDFCRDFAGYQRKGLQDMGYRVRAVDPYEVSIRFFSVLVRRIPARPRRFHVAPECICPDQLQAGFDMLKARVTQGHDLTCYQSDHIMETDHRDLMFFDWGIHHFHLGATKIGAFVKRTRSVLLAMVTDTDMYCITIRPHKGWAEKELIRIVHRNWPDLMEQHRAPFTGLSREVTDGDLEKLRERGISTFIDLGDGNIFFSPGGGYMKSRHSMTAMRAANEWHNYLKLLEKQVLANTEDICRELQAKDTSGPRQEYHLRLDCREWPDTLSIRNVETGLVVQLPEPKPRNQPT